MQRRGVPRLTDEEVQERINKYGYYFTDNTTYKNVNDPMELYDAQENKKVKLSMRQINYRVSRGYRSEFDIYNVLNQAIQQQAQQQAQQQPAGYVRFINKLLRNFEHFNTLSEDEKQVAYNKYQSLCARLNSKRKFMLEFGQSRLNPDLKLFIFIEALETVKKRMDKRLKIKITDKDDREHYYELSYDTIDYFKGLLEGKTQQELNTSENDLFESQNDWSTIDVFYMDKIKAGGFFPFLNKSSLDLSQFDIFNEINYENYKNNCFIDALINSNKFNEEEINLLKSSVYTRLITFDYIQKICDLLNIDITLRIPNDENYNTTAKIFKSKNKSRFNLVMFIYYDHFMINNDLFLQEYYISHYKELDEKYPNDITRYDIIDDAGNKKHQKMQIIRCIKLLRKYNLLEEISEEEQMAIARQYKHFQYTPKEIINEYFREITIKDKSDNQQDLLNKILNNDGYYLFGEHIEDKNKLNELYDQLQEIINGLGVNVRVRNYNKFAELMNKIMYEYGCFENVYELAQPLATIIRNDLVFPKPHTTDGNKFYSNKKLYYVDLNSAYLSVIEGIPKGKCDKDGNFTEGLNTKIKELINKLYTIRQQLKKTNPILATCLKYLSTSCWGSSIKKNRMFKTVKPKDKDQFIASHINFVIEHDNEIVKLVKSVSFQYSYPQFAREVLNNYHKKMNEIKNICKIYYENIDAILIDEEDYNKLVSLGYVGNELGKFKIEHIFTEIAISSSRKFVATLEDGTRFIHCPKKDTNYDEFIENVKNNKFTTQLTI